MTVFVFLQDEGTLQTALLCFKVRGRPQISLLILNKFDGINLFNFYAHEIIRKPKVFWWFQGVYKLINSLKFTHDKKENLAAILKIQWLGDVYLGLFQT